MRRLAVAAMMAVLASGATKAGPCDSAEYRQFDFWLGDWTVMGVAGKQAGENRITREQGGCVLHERYVTPNGYTGESFNMYDATRKVWHQTWVDNSGGLLLLEGGLQDKHMVLEGQTTGADGKPIRHRITWTPNADGSVRQHWQSTDSKGEWLTAFDGTYSRKPQ